MNIGGILVDGIQCKYLFTESMFAVNDFILLLNFHMLWMGGTGVCQNKKKRLNREGVLLLHGLDSRLSKDLPSDLQKLRCKVAFHALRFSAPILELGNYLLQDPT